MLHRFVLVVARHSADPGYAQLVSKLAARFHGWAIALDTPIAKAWSISRAPSRLGFRNEGTQSCVVGIDFNSSAMDLSSGIRLKTQPDLKRWGAYVGVDVDLDRNLVRVSRDPTGRIECWRIELPSADVLFSHLPDVHDLLREADPVNWDFISYHLNQCWFRGEETGLRGISELLPGQCIEYSSSGVNKQFFWRPDLIAEQAYGSVMEATKAIREAVLAAVDSWARQYGLITLDLSGGLDSAIVLGALRENGRASNVIGVNYVIARAEGDEREYARAAAALNGVQLVEKEVPIIESERRPSFSRRLMRPTIRVLSLGYDEVGAAVARETGAEAFFTGTGGDHVFYDNLKITAICDHRRQHGLGNGFLSTAHELASLTRSTMWHAFAETLRDMAFGHPRSLGVTLTKNPFLTEQARRGVELDRFGHPLVRSLASVGPAKLRQIFNITELQLHYARYGRADVMEEVHPLFSEPVMTACLRTPAAWFAAGQKQRGLARRIFEDLLPESIRNRRTKGVNSSHWIQTMERDLPNVRQLLLDGWLVHKGLLDRDSLAAALTPLTMSSKVAFGPIAECLSTEMWVRQALEDCAGSAKLMVA